MNKKLILILIGVILCGLIFFSMVRNAARTRLLQAVHLESATGLKERGYTNWTDWLKYKDGYEIIVFSVDKEKWQTPAEWTQEQTPVTLDEVESALGVRLDRQGLNKLNAAAGPCFAWFFLDAREDEKPFDQREYYLAYVAETADSLTVVIYRGHSLHGIN